jgi:hypothetical protein
MCISPSIGGDFTVAHHFTTPELFLRWIATEFLWVHCGRLYVTFTVNNASVIVVASPGVRDLPARGPTRE